MARPVSKTLTEGELRIMTVLWEHGPSSAQEIAARLRRPKVSRSSVMTILAVLERKGYIRHTQRDRTYIFAPVLDARGARRSAIQTVLSNFFGGSVNALVASLIDDGNLSAEEIRSAREIIDQASARSKDKLKRMK